MLRAAREDRCFWIAAVTDLIFSRIKETARHRFISFEKRSQPVWECVGERFDEGAGISVDVAGGLHDEGYEDVANCLDGGCVFGNFGIGSRLCSDVTAVWETEGK